MDPKGIAGRLNTLVQLDIDAVHAYDQAIAAIDAADIRERMSRYRDDHQRHVTDLGAVVRQLGETPPATAPDFKGFIIQGFTSLRSLSGTDGALRAMHTNEKLTNTRYEQTLGWDLPLEVRAVVQAFLTDERTHIEYIVETLAGRQA